MGLALRNDEAVVGIDAVCPLYLAPAPQIPTVKKNDAIALGVVLALFQVFDGVLTSVGISRYGTAFEGNPIIRVLMEEFGHVAALGVVKSIAVLIVVALTYFAGKLPWVKKAMGAVTCIYLFAAIIPWTYILFFRPLI
jgi:uncharacterized membrane protein